MKFSIVLTREDDGKQGLRPLLQLIVNGLSVITTNIEILEYSNSLEIEFEIEPESIESSFPFEGEEDEA